ncbi:nucleotidyltransferase domain-containing protein [Candidatus Pacearchaeota archaeon]|nr:nucleotidyltransferase domain-containing protein [Candidatus Pacearchaeota archaeon]
MKLIKKAVEIGNGAAVYVPKEYSGKEVVIILPEGVEEIKKRILNNLVEFMPNILGVYLYGSYARGEQETESDVDVLIITKEKDNKIKIILEDIDARVVSLDELKKTIRNYPLFIMPILREAKTLLNPVLLEDLRNSSIDFRKFNWNFEDIGRIIKIAESFIKLDDKDISPSLIYSLIMRIRVCYIIECLLKGKEFSNKGVEKLLLSYGADNKEIERFFHVYRLVRDEESPNIKINEGEVLVLLNILKDYLKKLKDETKKKIGERN